MINSTFPHVTDATGLRRVYLQHERSGFTKSRWVVPIVPGYVVVSCGEVGSIYDIEKEYIGDSPNVMICDYIFNLQKYCTLSLSSSNISDEDADNCRTILLFINYMLELASDNLLNCRAGYDRSSEIYEEIVSSVNRIIGGSLASAEIVSMIVFLSNIECFGDLAAFA